MAYMPNFSSAIDNILFEMQMDKGSYNTHSFRIGGSTSTIGAGILQVKMLGKWKSNAYQCYVRTPPEKLASLSKKLFRDPGVVTLDYLTSSS